MSTRKTEDILIDIKSLIYSKGYIYALCMILFEDFHFILKDIHKADFKSRLSKNEVSLLIGFLIQKEINFSFPDKPFDILKSKEITYELMQELHISLLLQDDEQTKNVHNQQEDIDSCSRMKLLHSKDTSFYEAIFYANDGVYSFQYRDFLERKYNYDKQWLTEHRNFDIYETKVILQEINKVLDAKSKKVEFLSLKEKLPEFKEKFPEVVEKFKAENPYGDWDEHIKEVIPYFEFAQYANFFSDIPKEDSWVFSNDIPDEEWKSFYNNLIDLFVIRKDDFDDSRNIDAFLNNFSSPINTDNLNSQFNHLGDFNLFNAQPILQLDNDRFFIPVMYCLYEACYESPYYWMIKDEDYIDNLAEHRGNASEEISYEFLSKVFGKERTFKSVKIITQKGHPNTDVDVLCILGSMALCVQVKSKKLTELSRKGNYSQLITDFKGAVQDAYEQGLVSRSKILESGSKFYDESESLIVLPEGIEEVYIMGVTSENYPSLSYQAHTLLEKKPNDPYAQFLTIFELEIVTYYLHNPYDLLYYIRQRIALMDYFKADNEKVYLGYHLENKLWRIPNNDIVALYNDFGGAIDRNYYPFRLGANITNEGDSIKNKWKNADFESLCSQLAKSKEPKITDIIFTLFDWDEISRDNLMEYIRKIKKQTLVDNRWHNFSILSKNCHGNNSGVTYVSWGNDNPKELLDRLSVLSNLKKYASRGDIWVGFGSLRNSTQIIDYLVFNNEKWQYNAELEKTSHAVFNGRNHETMIKLGKKSGRNEKCNCGSGLKYKNCCGKPN